MYRVSLQTHLTDVKYLKILKIEKIAHTAKIFKDVHVPNFSFYNLLQNFYSYNFWYATSESVKTNEG